MIMKIMKFSAPWCSPCAAYKPVFDKVVKDLKIENESIDVDEKPEIGGKYRVMSIPTTIIIWDDWEVLSTRVWVLKEEELIEEIKKYFKI